MNFITNLFKKSNPLIKIVDKFTPTYKVGDKLFYYYNNGTEAKVVKFTVQEIIQKIIRTANYERLVVETYEGGFHDHYGLAPLNLVSDSLESLTIKLLAQGYSLNPPTKD